MTRILGFVVGAMLVFGGLYYLLTPPGVVPGRVELELTPPSTAAEPESEPESAPEPEPAMAPEESAETDRTKSPNPAPPPESAPIQYAGGLPPDADGQSPSAVDIADEQALVEQALAAMQARQMHEQQPAPVDAASPAAAQDPDATAPQPADHVQWFAVWDPFHSELSANAFARRLERMTGLDYRVVRSGPAKYEVAVAFGSEEERVANIAVIEEATGLRIAGGSL